MPRRIHAFVLLLGQVIAGPACIRVSLLAALLMAGSAYPADAHSWYPKECCSDHDCAPIESFAWEVPTGGGTPQLMVTSKNGKAVVPQSLPARESKDGRSHVCMRFDPFGSMEVVCLFNAPGA